jgi:uncharacterized sulfatase
MRNVFILAAMMLAMVVPAQMRAAAAAVPDRPNVVLIISDDQGWSDFGFMGSKNTNTPNLDKLAADSAVFPNGYVPTSLCRASLATLLTGLYGSQHKICCNDFPTAKERSETHPFIRSVPTVPRLLAEKGYASFQTGKFWEGHHSNAGFTDGMTTQGRHGDEGLAIGRKTMQPIYDFVDRSARAKKPFFVWYAPMMPHANHNPPKRIAKKYEGRFESKAVANYYAMCEWFDQTCGQLIDFLVERKLRDNTIILFVIDNGWVQNPDVPNKPLRSKLTPYDAGLRTPILISWKDHVKPARYDDLVSSIDLPPTILTACNIAPPKSMPGLNLLDVAAGNGPLKRDAVFGEIFTHDAVSLDRPELSITHLWLRSGEWKLIRPQPGKGGEGDPELYNIADDPTEQRNLAPARPEEVKRLGEMLDRWRDRR